MIKKLFICPWFGELPSWFDKYLENIKLLEPMGYKWLITHDLDDFNRRCMEKLGFISTITPGTGKLHDYRPALGVLFEKELREYDFWGHTDFDCIYGQVDKWITDDFLSKLDIHSNHVNYICGPWTLYRNNEKINNLFRETEHWKGLMQEARSTAWIENQFSKTVDTFHNKGLIKREYTFWQSHDANNLTKLKMDNGKLYDNNEEIFMAHFNRKKIYPL